MARKRLCYPCLGDVPSLLVNIVNARSGRKHLFQMLVDTGASHTSIPAGFAWSFGHDNEAAGVATTEVKGIGGKSPAYIHALRLELIDPAAKTWTKLVPPWRSPKLPVHFVEKMERLPRRIGAVPCGCRERQTLQRRCRQEGHGQRIRHGWSA